MFYISALGLNTITLSGTATPGDAPISTYQWAKLSGASITLEDANTDNATFTAPLLSYPTTAYEDFLFNLTVTDNNSNTGSDNVAVRVKWAFKDDFTLTRPDIYRGQPLGDLNIHPLFRVPR